MNYKKKLNNITTFIFDVDGVLTNSTVLLFENGEVVRSINSKDGYALYLALKKGYRIAIITGGSSQAVKKTFEEMGIKDVFLTQHNKFECYTDYKSIHQFTDEQVLYMGDDLPDYETMSHVALPTCPNDAAHEIKKNSQYISHKKGGEGCVRDVIEQVLRCQNKWEISNW